MGYYNSDNKTCVYLVDDDSEDQELFSDALSEVEISTRLTVFNDCEAMLHELQTSRTLPDVIFLDLYMPGMSGEECIQNIRRVKAFDRTPVVIYSTSYHPEQVAHLFDLGANRYLQKPISFQELISSITSAIASSVKHGVNAEPVYDLVELS